MRRRGADVGVAVRVYLHFEDFLLSRLACERPLFDVILSNPPYFKLAKNDERAVRHSYVVHGQPNIYGLFMAACARLLVEGGQWCFITPRSWTNGAYFTRVRRELLDHLNIEAIHAFESRQDHFAEDEILQEAMITWASSRNMRSNHIVITTSCGSSDLGSASVRRLPACEIVGDDNRSVISIPSQATDRQPFAARLSSLGLRVSTGPVVAFRAKEHIREQTGKATVPLLWMQHVTPMRISWPIRKKKEHIVASGATTWMLVPNQNMVVLRRFSPKEAKRRITAAPYIANSIPGELIGLENHTNYIYRPGGNMSEDEVRGLAAYLNSTFVDAQLRSVSGNTQVNAGDLRALPIASLDLILAIGGKLKNKCNLEASDTAVTLFLSNWPEASAA
jgi:adenine-specific DNA-methyltransferase